MLLSYNIFSRYYYFYSPHVAGNIIGAEQNSPYGDVFWSHRDQGPLSLSSHGLDRHGRKYLENMFIFI